MDVTLAADGETLSAIARWIGVAVATAGAVSVNPNAAQYVALGTQTKARRGWSWVHSAARRVFPRTSESRGEPTGVVASARGGGWETTGEARATVHWRADATVDRKLELLDKRAIEQAGEIYELRNQLNALDKSIDGRIDQRLGDQVAKLERADESINRHINESTAIDARAIPVIVAGTVLTGLDSEVPKWPTLVAIAFIGGLTLLAAVQVDAIWRQWRNHRSLRYDEPSHPESK